MTKLKEYRVFDSKSDISFSIHKNKRSTEVTFCNGYNCNIWLYKNKINYLNFISGANSFDKKCRLKY